MKCFTYCIFLIITGSACYGMKRPIEPIGPESRAQSEPNAVKSHSFKTKSFDQKNRDWIHDESSCYPKFNSPYYGKK